ncbi:hypothetical protein DH2020_044004 [Rehmannia glutinosa]|uniref:GRAM domain-containing protein n=1 Tax=Rehmannia glutinosa TaxID=99300 RepID=A0ABR0UII7_REHGL
MKVQQRNSGIGKKNVNKENVIGIPISSVQHAFFCNKKSSTNALLPDPASQYQILPSPSKQYSKNIRHIKLGPKLSETVKGKLSLGARILQVGGVDKVFRQKFNIGDDEKLLKASQCYLSTTAGPIAGLLFISNDRVAFCSERSIKVSSPTGKLLKVHYKVMIPLTKIKRAIESENVKKPTQKYVQLVTEDNFEFWFMGFLNHQTTLKYLHQAIHQAR